MLKVFIAALLFTPSLTLAADKNYEVKIDGMTCAPCAQAVTAALEKVEGIEKASVKVVLKAKSATLRLKDDNQETVAAIKAAIKKAGYTVTSVAQVAGEAMSDANEEISSQLGKDAATKDSDKASPKTN